MRKANSSGTLLRKTRYWWRALLGMALAVAMLLAMALPQGQWNLLGAEKAQAATVQQMFDALPDASTVPNMTEAQKAQARKKLLNARLAYWGTQGPDGSVDTSHGDALGEALTVWPDGVTADDVKDYIDENFTKPTDFDGQAGGSVWPETVWYTVRTWGSDWRKLTYTNASGFTSTVFPKSAADVVEYLGYECVSQAWILLNKPLDGPLYGYQLLQSIQGIQILDAGKYTGYQFQEEAYEAVAKASGRDLPNQRHFTAKGPYWKVKSAFPVLNLPEHSFDFNLPRTFSGAVDLSSTTQYFPYEGYVVRGSKPTVVNIDTLLQWYKKGEVNLNTKIEMPNWLCNPLGAGCSMPIVDPSFAKYANIIQDYDGEVTDAVTTPGGNAISMSIPGNGADGNYQEMLGFQYVYNYYANTQMQSNSIDYYYRLHVKYLSVIDAESLAVLSGFRFIKKDDGSQKTLPGAVFEVYQKDDSGNEVAPHQAQRDANGNIQFDQNGNIEWAADKIQVTSDANGEVKVPDLEPGTYYYREITAPNDYQLDSTEHQITVNAVSDIPSDITVQSGSTSTMKTLPSAVKLKTNKEARNTSSWLVALDNKSLILDGTTLNTSKASDYGGDVFVENDGDAITVPAASQMPDKYKYRVIGYQNKDDALASRNGKVEYGGDAGDTLSNAVKWVNDQITDSTLADVSPILRLEPVDKVVVDDSYLTGTAPTVTNKPKPQQVKGSFSFAKRDGDETSKALAGATFRLFECKAGAGRCGTGTSAGDVIDPDDPGDAWTRVGSDVTSGGDGLVTFDDLARPGEYRLVEVASPAGYAKPAGQWRVTYSDRDVVEPRIESVGEAPAFFTVSRSLAAGASVSPASVRAGNSMLAVPNYKTIAVPSTGGRGLMLFSLAGFGLLLAGVTVLSIEARRRG
ncbi:SpaA isopeptide-forming pilin-related protein [Bifidobacterium cebidarum]|uniref:Collagen-binding protein n=1 Tax=Bifidobacterium cebidarum TaxID=2650773 RepID=A0A6I1GFX0_9BIFI|nr:SpaA isopeptide-forming pilin-related protein [Bifidobacterium cebidarum]KAB7788596.1 collagen-binding protein [Bifidobacterium cebidarum]